MTCARCGELHGVAYLADCPAYDLAPIRLWVLCPSPFNIASRPAQDIIRFLRRVRRVDPPVDYPPVDPPVDYPPPPVDPPSGALPRRSPS